MSKGGKKISFKAMKKVSKPSTIKFTTKSGDSVNFTAQKKVTKPVKVEFYAKKKK